MPVTVLRVANLIALAAALLYCDDGLERVPVEAVRPALLSAGLTAPDSQWWTYQANTRRTGFVADAELEPPLTLKWQADISQVQKTIVSAPVFGRDKIFVATRPLSTAGKIYALSQQTGSIVWTFQPTNILARF